MTADDVHDKEGFIKFLGQLREGLTVGTERWQNVELDAFLEAMSAWANDWPGPFAKNPWAHAARLVEAGAMYE